MLYPILKRRKMPRSQKVLTTILIIIIGLLAVGAGFFYSENTSLKKQIQLGTANQNVSNIIPQVEPSTSITTPSDIINNNTTSPAIQISATPSPTPTTTTTSKPVAGSAGTYTVKTGDTMSTIANGLGVNWLDLAKANGLDANTANKIKIGQVLTVPKK